MSARRWSGGAVVTLLPALAVMVKGHRGDLATLPLMLVLAQLVVAGIRAAQGPVRSG
jgi:hypothetical protein